MNIDIIRSDKIYREMVHATPKEKEEIYRDKLMKPFEFKWKCVGIPLKAEQEGGYDVVSASSMGGGYHPSQITDELQEQINRISEEAFWNTCKKSIQDTLESFESHGMILPVQSYHFTILLNNPDHPMSAMNGDYCGDGGIPGYIIGTIIPNDTSIKMLPVALAHEANHNVRWQFIPWNANITLADMIVSEGLAENFAAQMYGEDKVGVWIKNTDEETLQTIIKPAIKQNLQEKDFNKVSGYLYGDEIMSMRGGTAVGMPYCAGYACGYALIKHYLKKTGKDIYQATITKTIDILKETEDFWE